MASNTNGMTIDIGANTSAFNKALSSMNNAISSSQSALSRLNNALKIDPSNINLLKDKQAALNDKLTAARDKVKDLQSEYDKINAQKKNGYQLTEQEEKNYRKLKDELDISKVTLKALEKEYQEFGSVTTQVFKNIGEKVGEFGNKVSNLGKSLAPLSAAAGGLIASGIKYNMQLENYMTNLTTLLGSGEKAEKLLTELKQMAATTPFATDDLIKATQTMIGYGVETEKAQEYLGYLGDIAMGDKDKLSGLSLAFAQVQAAGKLTGQDLNQMINQGFNPLQFMAEKTGKSISTLKDEMGKGKISAEDVAEAFKYATQEGQPFYQAMENGSKTISGRISTLKDNFQTLIGQLTESLLPTFEKFIDKLSEMVNWFSNLSPEMKNFITSALLIVTALSPILIILGKLITIVGLIITKIGVFIGFIPTIKAALIGLATCFTTPIAPILLVVGAIAGIIAILVVLYNKCEWFRNIVNTIVENIVTFVSNAITKIGKFFTETIPSWISYITGEILPNLNYYIGYFIGLIVGKIATFFVNLWNKIITELPQLIQKIVEFVKQLPEKIQTWLKVVIEKVKQWLSDWLDNVKTQIPIIVDTVIDYFKELPSKIVQVGKDLIEGLWNGITSMGNWLKDKIGGFANGIIDGFKKSFDIGSPSKVMEKEVRTMDSQRCWNRI